MNEIQLPVPVVVKNTVRLNNELFDKARYKLGTHAQRLLFTIASNLESYTAELFPEMELDIVAISRCMGLENNKDRYNIILSAFIEIGRNPLEVIELKENNKGELIRNWKSIPWFSSEYDESIDSKIIKLTFHDKAKSFLLQLKKKFTTIRLEYLFKLPTESSTYLYPLIQSHFDRKSKHQNIVIFTLSITRLKEFTYHDDAKEYPTYDPNKYSSANRDYLRRVIGIERNSKSKNWEYAQRKVKGKSINSGALWDITKNTNTTVTARAIKKGRSFEDVEFTAVLKSSTKSVRKNSKKQLELSFHLFDQPLDYLKEKYPDCVIEAIDDTTYSSLKNNLGMGELKRKFPHFIHIVKNEKESNYIIKTKVK